MAKQRQISDKFWNDRYVAEELTDPEEKLLFIYLLTNTLINITGIYEISLKQISFDTNIPIDKIKTIIQKLSDAGKVHYETGYIILTNYHKYTSYNTDNVRGYVINYLEKLPKSITEQHSPTIDSILALASPSAESNQGQGKGRARDTNKSNQGQGKGRARDTNKSNQGQGKGLNQYERSPAPGQPYTTTSIPTSISNSIPSSPPSPPKGVPATDPQVWVKDPVTGQLIRNPALEGRRGGKENNQSSGKGREEGRNSSEEEEIVDWGAIKIKGSDVDKLYEEFGKDVAWDAIDKAADWAEAKGIKVNKDPYKFVRGFALKEASNG